MARGTGVARGRARGKGVAHFAYPALAIPHASSPGSLRFGSVGARSLRVWCAFGVFNFSIRAILTHVDALVMCFICAYGLLPCASRASLFQRCIMSDEKPTTPEQPTGLEAAEAALDRLATKLAPPSIGAQIRRLLPKINAAMAAGASHEQIVQTLRETGIEVSMNTFRSALYRARKRAQKDSRKEERAGGGASGGGAASGPPAAGASAAVSSGREEGRAIRWRCRKNRSPSTGTRPSGRTLPSSTRTTTSRRPDPISDSGVAIHGDDVHHPAG